MKSVQFIGSQPRSLPVAADDIIELHAARILLLLRYCGSEDRITGLTKLAKLDFFVRYPNFFSQVAAMQPKNVGVLLHVNKGPQSVESSMVRHHYGPWDKRYYQVLGFLESRQLLTVAKVGKTFDFSLTDIGVSKAKTLSRQESFGPMVAHMKAVKKLLGRKTGSQLKDMVYKAFDEEIGQRKLGDVIR